MNIHWTFIIAVSLWTAVNGPSINVEATEDFDPTTEQVNRTITIIGDEFMVDGKPLRIVSGALHYFRLPAAYWRDRLRKYKAAGLNSVSSYVEWSFHEPEERQYSFDGDRDVAQFIRIAAEEGLYVLLRVGPYICAERDLGGFPYWLLGKYPNIKLRSTDKNFIDESKLWLNKLFEQVSPLLYGNGGPIILVQVENEYGSTGYNEMAYKETLRDMMHQHVGTNALLYTTDGCVPDLFIPGSIPNTLTTIDFNAFTDVNTTFEGLRKYMPHGPLMNSEFYTGWLTHWGSRFSTTDADDVVKALGNILDYGANLNLYLFFGGSNFEFTSGANYDENYYEPDITSYDFDAPLNEAGDPTPKYYLIRDKLKEYNLVDESVDPPTPSPKGAYGAIRVSLSIKLLSPEGRLWLGKKYDHVIGSTLPTFEALRQRAGLMLYETNLPKATGSLCISKPRDMVFVYVDDVYTGCISRMLKKHCLTVSSKKDSVLSLLVESQGRINFGDHIHDFKGILSPVQYNNSNLDGKWSITGYPLESYSMTLAPESNQIYDLRGPTMYDAYFTLPPDEEPLDTFIDTTDWGKGYIWVNGHNLGRYWPGVGPQITLYVPGVWLKKSPAENHLQILELDKASVSHVMTFVDKPILNHTSTYLSVIKK